MSVYLHRGQYDLKGEKMFKKRGEAASVCEIIKNNTGFSVDELSDMEKKEYGMRNSDLERFFAIVDAHEPKLATICGDYDVDGITSTFIMKEVLESKGYSVSVRFPKRMSEGFGLSEKAISEIPDGSLVVTVDNGVTAFEAIDAAKKRGFTVIVTDHHIAGERLPNADLIINPKAIPEQFDFDGYCGAGVAYKIAEKCGFSKKKLSELEVIAAIGTVADAMPLLFDNRKIVKEGLENARNGDMPKTLRALFNTLKIDENFVNEEDIGFKIAPCLNAPGRLLDDGAILSYKVLRGELEPEEIAELNIERQKLVKEAVTNAETNIINNDTKPGEPIVYIGEQQEGISGIIAGQLTENHHVPSFVFVRTEKGYKGSGRAPEGYNLKEMLDEVSDLLVFYGGHECAAGCTVKFDSMAEFRNRISMICNEKGIQAEDANVISYDLEIGESDLVDTINEVEKYAPYGAANPAPVIKVIYTLEADKYGNKTKALGKDGSSIRFNGRNHSSAICFGGLEKYEELSRPDRISAVGTLSMNHWGGYSYPQIKLIDFEADPNSGMETLGSMMTKKLRNK